MDTWLSERIEATIEPDIEDELTLRWGRQIAINNANLLTKLFHRPNCIDPSPGGSGLWNNVDIGGEKIRIIITDTSDDCMEISVKFSTKGEYMLFFNGRCRSGYRSGLEIKCSYFREGFGILFSLIKLSSGDTFFEAFRLYNKIMRMTTTDLAVFFRVNPEIARAKSAIIHKEKDVIPYIPKDGINFHQTDAPVESKSINVESTSIPTVIGNSSKITSSLTTIYPERDGNVDIRTPEGIPVDLLK